MKILKIICVVFLITALLSGCTGDVNKDSNGESKQEEIKNEESENEVSENESTEENKEEAEANQEKERPTEVEAIFYNNFIGFRLPSASGDEFITKGHFVEKPSSLWIDWPVHKNQVVSYYDIAENDDKLYAFAVSFRVPESGEPEGSPKEEDYENRDEYLYESGLYRHKLLVEAMQKTDVLVMKDYPYTLKGICGGELAEHEFYYFGGNREYSVSVVIGTIDDILEVFAEDTYIGGWNYRLVSVLRPDAVKIAEEKGITEPITVYNYPEILGTENQVSVRVAVE